MRDLLEAADHAALQSDRWLFIAVLLVGGLFAVGVMRYFVRQHERLIADHKQARDSYQESLRGIVSEQSAANQKLIACLDNNSRVLEECRDELHYRWRQRRHRR
jgi:type VI protein secretion system component VasK